MRIHHIGYFVENIENAVKGFQRLGFSRIGEITEDSYRGVYILFLDNSGLLVEIIQPISEESPIYRLSRKYKNSPYHICYQTSDISTEIEKLVNDEVERFILTQPPQPAPAIPSSPNVAFLVSGSVGMIELVEIKG